jgi:hypothetical protein
MAWRGWLISVGLLLAACSAPPAEVPTIDPRIRIEALPSDPASRTARAIADLIQRKYALVQVWDVSAEDGGEVVAYAVRLRLDPRSLHPDPDDWQAHVSRAARDQRQAAVEILKLTVRLIHTARLVSVFQDDFLQPRWTRRQIRQMDDPAAYRSFEAWQDLVLSAAVLPGAGAA